jgi:outer membrane protein OmpA-like peptidoglycan-associated protein
MLQRACACGNHTAGGGECAACARTRLERSGDERTLDTAPPIVHEALRAPGQPLDPTTRAALGARVGHNFSRVPAGSAHPAAEEQAARQVAAGAALRSDDRSVALDVGRVRLHTDPPAAAAAAALGAHAFTYGDQIAFGAGQFAPHQQAGLRLLAHEMTHVAQQHGQAPRLRLQAAQDDPQRFARVHENLFTRAPSGGTRRPWVDPSGSERGTAAELIAQFIAALRQLIADRPEAIGGTVPTRTTEAAAESDALAIDPRIRARFPIIPTVLSEQQIRDAINIIGSADTLRDTFLRQWLANKMHLWTDAEEFAIDESDVRYQEMLGDLLGHSFAGPRIRILASRQSAFAEEDQQTGAREVFLNRGISAAQRVPTLIHELVHFYAHADYKRWVDATAAPRFYNEGMTEYLARKVMTPEELAGRTSYNDAVQAVEQQVAQYIPDNDIMRAFFLGEVWRIEHRSPEAERQFERQVGIPAQAARQDEVARSQVGPGIVQAVTPGARYRFMNLGVNQSVPKPEHEAELRRIYQEYVAGNAAVRLRFVGHASAPGSDELNARLSRRRAAAFVRLARAIGVPVSQIVDATRPAAEGETSPTADNAEVIGRAFNRRVELFLESAAAPAAAPTPAEDDRE